ncbi:hypothetical protein F4780DRAFT_784416 [Xylariomycetidae sp. FL0641]|nr:hypothetical protein F4780DRAFT_784416 [Xylariomycetidae sp. FL0641]
MSDATPLLQRTLDEGSSIGDGWQGGWRRARANTRRFFGSKAKHWLILTLIVLDVAGILADIFITLVTCELHREKEPWVAPTKTALSDFSIVMSCAFVIELALSIFASGWSFFSSWFECFDAFVIVVSFCIDVLERGVAVEIASLIVILRLWRFVKIMEEFSVEASEEMEELRKRVEELEAQNATLEAHLGHR